MKNSKGMLGILIIGLGLHAHGQAWLTNGLVAYYPFNGNANDASGNGNHAMPHNVTAAADRFGSPNAAYSFSTTDNYIQTPVPSGTNTYTISIWANCNASGLRGLVGNDDENWSGKTLFLYNGVPRIYNANPITYVGTTITATQPVPYNAWSHVVCSVDAGTVTFYINGKPCGTFSGVQSFGTNWVIGGKGVHITQAPFSGLLDDVRIYERALSESEVQQLYAIEAGPRVDLIKAVKPSFSNLTITTNYQMQVSADLTTWTNHGSPFIATNTSMVFPQYWDVDNWNSLYFRLQVVP